MRAKKVDETHREIRDALRNAGVSVFDTSAAGFGFPDLACAYRGHTALLEAKTGDRQLRESQQKFVKNWQGVVIVARSGPEAVEKFFASFAVATLRVVVK